MKKMLTLVLALMLALTVVGACAEKQVLTVVTWDANTTPYLIAQEAAFEAAYPNIDLQYVDVASQDYAIKVGTMLSGGDESDLFMVKQNINIMNWAQQGFAEPLTDYIAKDNFDLSGGVKFSTSAVPMIIGEIRRYLRDNNAIRVSRSLRDIAYKALQIKERILNNENREATIEEVAKELEIPKEYKGEPVVGIRGDVFANVNTLRKIVLPETSDVRVLTAASIIHKEKIAKMKKNAILL